MNEFEFGARSTRNLETCDERLERIARRALAYGILDFSCIEGHRSTKRQQRLFHSGKTTLDGIDDKSKHQTDPALAMDLLPYPGKLNGVDVWEDYPRFCRLAGLIQAAAAEEGIKIRWGGDWDGDGNNADSKFDDFPHFELVIII